MGNNVAGLKFPRILAKGIRKNIDDPTNIRGVIKHPEKFFIGGRWTVPSFGPRLNVITPLTEQVYFTVAEAHEADSVPPLQRRGMPSTKGHGHALAMPSGRRRRPAQAL